VQKGCVTVGIALNGVAIVANFNITDKMNEAIIVAQKLMELGCKVYMPSKGEERIRSCAFELYDKVTFLPFDKLYKNVDAVIAMGGDGTILETARYAASDGIPVLGMNLGRLGYLAELETNELELLADIVAGNYTVDERSMLKVSVNSVKKGKIYCGYALNDAIVSYGSAPKLIDLDLLDNGTPIATYRSDGLIISTPTGSTAYSMAAGGAVVDPRLKCFCVTPICSHSLTSKPLIFPDSAAIEVVNISRREKTVSLTLDGRRVFDIYFGDTVCVGKAPIVAKLIRIKPRSFYQTLRSKLNSCDNM
jgi:NAD+ kinase